MNVILPLLSELFVVLVNCIAAVIVIPVAGSSECARDRSFK
jgi:hypothetical protein